MPTSGRASILLVVEDVLVRNFLNTALTAAGYLVYTAANTGEAAELARAFSSRMQLLFACLPAADGMELAERLLLDFPRIRAVVASPSTQDLLATKTMPVGLVETVEGATSDPDFPRGPVLI